MCGIVGLITKNKNGFSKEQQDIFSTLLFVDLLRGADSTGVFTVNNDGDVYVAKDAVHSMDFLQKTEYEEAQRRAFTRGMAMVGHNRKATRGTVNDKNAHPFNVDNNIVLVHNGTMHDDHTKHADVEVDSHAIAHLIHEKDHIGEALGSFYGAYALVWYDVENATINMIRNSQRPLWWMETPSAWIWASTPDMLQFVRHRFDLRLIHDPTELPEDTLQQYKLLPNRDWEVTNEKVVIKRPAYVPYNTGGEWQFGGTASRGHRFLNETHPDYDGLDEYVRDNWGDQAFEPEHGRTRRHHQPIQLLPRQPHHKSTVEVEAREPVEFAGLAGRERALAKESNNVVTYGEYQERIIQRGHYQWNTPVHCQPFDYSYVNGRDTEDGFYLYATPIDGDCVILRMFMSSKAVTEERIMQLASGGYVYEFNCTRKYWGPLKGFDGNNPNFRNDEPGYVIIVSNKAILLSRPDTKPQPTMH